MTSSEYEVSSDGTFNYVRQSSSTVRIDAINVLVRVAISAFPIHQMLKTMKFITLDSRVAGIRIYAINVLVGESCRQCIPIYTY
ncbi:hypothetical protein T07_8838 [Trichinella nelsoni]|uniref:Uncharacterized protein n=1 Tax=Trichinella nelsoni TaxID=6336 RepID=A0A0V0S0Z9_9BILA|nr:hypothetical protein T07_8838 [Trichinella nelsoni]